MKRLLFILAVCSSQAFAAGTILKTIGGAVAVKTASYVVTTADGLTYVTADTSSNSVNITLPAPGSNIGRQITVEHKSGDTNNACILFNNASDAVDGRIYTTEFCPNDGDKITLAAVAANQWKVVSYLCESGDGSKNFLINGNFDLWQRLGVPSTQSSSGYGPDRWYFTRTASQEAAPYVGGDFSGQAETILNTFVLSSSFSTFSNTLEYSDTVYLRGKTTTASVYAMTNSASAGYVSKIQIVYKTTTADAARVDGGTVICDSGEKALNNAGWLRISCSGYVPTTATNVGVILFTKSSESTSSLFMKGAMLQLGPVLSGFTLAGKSKAGEVALARRYYDKSFPIDIAPAHNIGSTYTNLIPCAQGGFGGNCYFSVMFSVPKRIPPSTINFYDVRAAASGSKVHLFTAGGQGVVATGLTQNAATTNMMNYNATDASLGAAIIGVMLDVNWAVDAEIAP